MKRLLSCMVMSVCVIFLSTHTALAQGLREPNLSERESFFSRVDELLSWTAKTASVQFRKEYLVSPTRPHVAFATAEYLTEHGCPPLCGGMTTDDDSILVLETDEPWGETLLSAAIVHEGLHTMQLARAHKKISEASCEDWATWETEAHALQHRWLREHGGPAGVYLLIRIGLSVPVFHCDEHGELHADFNH